MTSFPAMSGKYITAIGQSTSLAKKDTSVCHLAKKANMACGEVTQRSL
jgi:hypothetical protein